MAEEAKNKASASKFRTSIGGQALIEGVLMRGPGKQAIVVRSPDGLVEKVEELTLVRDKYPVLGLPIIRGAVTFVDSMVKGVKALMFSADYFPDEDVAEPSKFDQWLEKKLGNEKMQEIHHGAGGLSVAGADDPALFPAADVSGRLYRPVYQERGGAQSGRIRHQARDLLRLHDPVLQAEGHLPRVPVPRRGA